MFGLSLVAAGIVATLCGERELALEMANALTALTDEHSLSFRHVAAVCWLRGWLLTRENDLTQGIALMRKAMSIWETNQFFLGISLYASVLAGTLAMANQLDDGLSLIDQALPLAHQFREHIFEPELPRMRGELLMMRDKADWPEAENCIREALALATGRGARSLQLRAATSLARLLDGQGKRDEARATLAEIYGWFTEGFSTTDLKTAKALLDELSQ
jgi:predicted ATPase